MTLSQVFKSRLLSNIWNQFLLYGFSSIIPILLIPYLLNVIGVEKYGLVNFAIIFSFYFQIFNEFGFDLSNVRHVVNNRDNQEKLGRIVSSILQCKFFLILCSLFVYILVVGLIPSLRNELTLYILAFIRLIGVVIAPYWLFRSMEDIKYITRISVPIKLLCILPIFLIVKSTDDYALVMLCYALETFVSGIVALFIAQKRYGIKLQIVSAQEVKFYLKDSILGDFAVGLYTAAEKLHNAYSSFVSPLLSQIFYPYFTRIKNMGRATKMVLLLCIANTIALACIYFLSPYLIPIFIKTETASITTYFNLFLLLLAISVPADMFGFPYLGVLGKINEVNMTTIYSAIIYIIVVLVLILTHSISIGSVIWALIIANVGCLVLRLYLANKVRVGNVDKQ